MNCKNCLYKTLNKDGGWCYMFAEKMPDCHQYEPNPQTAEQKRKAYARRKKDELTATLLDIGKIHESEGQDGQ